VPAPLILLDEARELPLLRARLERQGWRVQEGFALEEQPWDLTERRVVCAGSVDARGDRDAALLAGARGAGVIAIALGSLPAEFVSDLERLGSLERRSRTPAGQSVDPETADLLRELAAGRSVEQAASACLMSRRTAYRRLGEARRALGVRTNRELLLEFERRLK
jgi:hypothetical protein